MNSVRVCFIIFVSEILFEVRVIRRGKKGGEGKDRRDVIEFLFEGGNYVIFYYVGVF